MREPHQQATRWGTAARSGDGAAAGLCLPLGCPSAARQSQAELSVLLLFRGLFSLKEKRWSSPHPAAVGRAEQGAGCRSPGVVWLCCGAGQSSGLGRRHRQGGLLGVCWGLGAECRCWAVPLGPDSQCFTSDVQNISVSLIPSADAFLGTIRLAAPGVASAAPALCWALSRLPVLGSAPWRGRGCSRCPSGCRSLTFDLSLKLAVRLGCVCASSA